MHKFDSSNEIIKMDKSYQESNILLLPIELTRKICTYLPPKACVALMLSCRALMCCLNTDRLLWQSIFHQLDIRFLKDDLDNDNEFFPSAFKCFIDTRNRILNHDSSNSTKDSSRLLYNIGYQKEHSLSSLKTSDHAKTKDDLKTKELLITHSTIVYDYDESYFVVIQTKDRSEFWGQYEQNNSCSSVPTYCRATAYSLKDGDFGYVGFKDLPFEVAAQDIKVYHEMLLLLPIKDPGIDENVLRN